MIRLDDLIPKQDDYRRPSIGVRHHWENTNKKQLKGNMQDKTEKKKDKKQIKIHDLKPVKDVKGGGGHTGHTGHILI